MSSKYTIYSDTVATLDRQHKLRKLAPVTPINGAYILYQDKRILSFCSHDYLSLGENPDVKKRAIKYLLEHGISASSEIDNVYLTCQQNLEKKLAHALQREAVHLFSSRFDANKTLLATIGHESASFFIHEDAHASLHRGAKQSCATLHSFNSDNLEKLLKASDAKNKIIATESVFSKSGAMADLPQLISLSRKYDALLIVDDSHTLGVVGVDGMGLSASMQDIDIITGSFSKAFGAFGGFVACKKTIRDYLLSLASTQRQYLFPPPILGAIDAALDLLPQLEGERKQLNQRSHWLRCALRDKGFSIPTAQTSLLSLPFPTEEEARNAREHLESNEIFIGPAQDSCLRIALNICHMPDHLSRLVDSIH